MSPFEVAGPVGAVAAHIFVARWIAAIAFLSLLAVLSLGLRRARKQSLCDEADAALEADFRRLERESQP